MNASITLKKAALVASVMGPVRRARLLASLPASVSAPLRRLIREVRRNGWAKRDLIEAVLGPMDAGTPQREIDLQTLVSLHERLDPIVYARVLAAARVDNRDFVLSLLPAGYGERVAQEGDLSDRMPERLRKAALVAAKALLSDRIVEGMPACAD